MEQVFPVLYHRFALREGSGGPGARRGGFGVHYEVELLRGDAQASFVMDHGRFGPPGVLGGANGAPNVVRIHRNGTTTIPEHLSKDQGIPMRAGDRVEVMTPGGGGYGDPLARDPAAVARDVRLGYYGREEVRALFGVALSADGEVDAVATEHLRAPPVIANGAMHAEGGQRSDAGPRAADRGSGTQSTDGLAPDQARGSASRMTGASR
jgi:N-methylhydantoinase B